MTPEATPPLAKGITPRSRSDSSPEVWVASGCRPCDRAMPARFMPMRRSMSSSDLPLTVASFSAPVSWLPNAAASFSRLASASANGRVSACSLISTGAELSAIAHVSLSSG